MHKLSLSITTPLSAFAIASVAAFHSYAAGFDEYITETLSSTIGERVDIVCDGVRKENVQFVSGDPESSSLKFRVEGREMTVNIRQISSMESVEVCPECDGNGYRMGDYDYTVEELVDCPNCTNGRIAVGYSYGRGTYGDGSVRHSTVGYAPRSGTKYKTCTRCNGTGKIKAKKTKNSGMVKNPCKACNGTPKKTVNLLQKAFLKYLRDGFESHVRIEKSQMIGENDHGLFVDDRSIIAALAALNLDWYELTDTVGRAFVLVCPEGNDRKFVGENIDMFHLADLGKGYVLVSDNQLVASFFKAKWSHNMNPSLKSQILNNCEAKVNQSLRSRSAQ